jgi:putative RNA 2'-phosphotransferase
MTDPALIERITRSLAFMLRHQPEKFDLELDPQGFAELDDVVQALNERLGEPVEDEDVVEAVRSGDRPRYEIQGERIRALYGHSIPIEPGPSSKPPEFLYVALPEREVERARRFGLRGGRRRFLHLALNAQDAKESGRRAARDYTVLVIRALDAWEEGIQFYDRTSLWLAEEIPTHLIEVEGTYHDGTEPLHAHEGGQREGGGHWQRGESRRPYGRDRRERRERMDRHSRVASPPGEHEKRGDRPLAARASSDAVLGRREVAGREGPEEEERLEARREESPGEGRGRGGRRRRGRRRGYGRPELEEVPERGRFGEHERVPERQRAPFQERPPVLERAPERVPVEATREARPPAPPAARPPAASSMPFGAGLDGGEPLEPPAPPPEPPRPSAPARRSEPPREEGPSSFGAGL